MYELGYKDCYEGNECAYPRDPQYMSGWLDAELEMEID
jgi:hypothetical protein